MLDRVFESPSDGHYFFGYYDKSPLDADCTRMLAQRTDFINRMPEAGDAIEIGHFDFPGGTTFTPLAKTTAWNWQQGSMLQWLGPGFDHRILYNDIREGHYRAIVRNLETDTEQILPMAAYTVSSDGRHALCIDYERLYWYRPGYNYQGPPCPEKKKPYDPADGIWRMSLYDGTVQKIISIEDVIALGPVSSMKGATHYLEHLMINPTNTRFAFLHRWLNVDGGIVARLITSDLNGRNLFVLNDSGRMSHFCWRSDDTVFGYGGTNTAFNKLRNQKAIAKHLIKPLLPLYHRLFPAGGAVSRQVTGDCYQIMKDGRRNHKRIDQTNLPDDGHPTFRPGTPSTIINDTYPNEDGDCRLYLFDIDQCELLAETTVPSDPKVRATGYRCDLHPKWSFDGRYVAIDTISTRGRGIAVYAIE